MARQTYCLSWRKNKPGWNHKRQMENNDQVMWLAPRLWRMDVIVFVYLFSALPVLLTAVSLTVWGWQFTSVYLESWAVVWIWIMNPLLIPSRRCWVPVAMATQHLGSERNLLRKFRPLRRFYLFLFSPLSLSLPLYLLAYPSLWRKPFIKLWMLRAWVQGWVVNIFKVFFSVLWVPISSKWDRAAFSESGWKVEDKVDLVSANL